MPVQHGPLQVQVAVPLYGPQLAGPDTPPGVNWQVARGLFEQVLAPLPGTVAQVKPEHAK